MAKSKSLASSIVVRSIFVIQLVNDAQLLYGTWVAWTATTVISHFTIM